MAARRRATLGLTVVLVLAAVAVLVVALTRGHGWAPDPAPSARGATLTPDTAAPATPVPPTTTAVIGQPPNGPILDLLAGLPVKGRAAKTGYDRAQFQRTPSADWTDTDGNRCDTRNDILRRDLDPETFLVGSSCVVASGTLHDPYTGKIIEFRQGRGTSSAVQVDHVVALADAWQKGAQALPASVRVAFANDPLNLLAVDGPTNAAKGDGDAATWLPPDRGAWCDYVAKQVAVKAKYHLWVTDAEATRMRSVIVACPTTGLPVGYTGG